MDYLRSLINQYSSDSHKAAAELWEMFAFELS